MYRVIREVTLKTGEAAELGLVSGPDREWGAKIENLLGHKGQPWVWQIHECLNNPTTGVETYCYVLSKNNRPIANISTFENHGVGIFGHVFTCPEERKKGAADLLNQAVMNDFQLRGGKALYLGTSFGSLAYHLYQKYGFQSVEPESPYMIYAKAGRQTFEKEYFAPGPTDIDPFSFKHWPVLPSLTMMDHPARLRILGMHITGPVSTEGGSLELLKRAHDTHQPVDAQVAVSKRTQALVVFACRQPEAYFGPSVRLLDVFYAPGFEIDAIKAISALNLPGDDLKTVCYSDSAWPQKGDVLKQAGFTPQTTLRNHFASSGRFWDVILWSKP